MQTTEDIDRELKLLQLRRERLEVEALERTVRRKQVAGSTARVVGGVAAVSGVWAVSTAIALALRMLRWLLEFAATSGIILGLAIFSDPLGVRYSILGMLGFYIPYALLWGLIAFVLWKPAYAYLSSYG